MVNKRSRELGRGREEERALRIVQETEAKGMKNLLLVDLSYTTPAGPTVPEPTRSYRPVAGRVQAQPRCSRRISS